MQPKPFYVYVHRRATDNQIFYVGKGQAKYKRAHQKGVHRSEYWHKVVTKYGRIVQIFSYWDTNEEACAEEKRLIEFFRGLGCHLVNITDGGEGTLGRRQSAEVRQMLSNCARKRTGKNSQRGIPVVIHFNSGEEKIFDTGREAAKYLGVKPCTLCDWMRGRYPPNRNRNIKSIRKGNQ